MWFGNKETIVQSWREQLRVRKQKPTWQSGEQMPVFMGDMEIILELLERGE